MADDSLSTWRDGPTKQAIIDFVRRTCGEDGSPAVPVEERVAVFDNDGTLWCEKPMPIQLDFIIRRLAEMAQAQPELRERQPWKAVATRDLAWFGSLMTEHYAGDDTNVRTLAGGILAAYAGISVEDFEKQSDTFMRTAAHPTLGRGYLECAYAPMVELLGYLDANGFATLHRLRRRPRFHAPDQPGHVRHSPRAGDRQQQHLRLHQQRQRRHHHPQARGRLPRRRPGEAGTDLEPHRPSPLLAAGNSNGDVPMLEFTHHTDKPTLRLLLLHDDAEREFDYTTGAEQALRRAKADRLDRRQHQERLDHRLLTSTRPASRTLHRRPRGQASRAEGRQRRLGNVRRRHRYLTTAEHESWSRVRLPATQRLPPAPSLRRDLHVPHRHLSTASRRWHRDGLGGGQDALGPGESAGASGASAGTLAGTLPQTSVAPSADSA